LCWDICPIVSTMVSICYACIPMARQPGESISIQGMDQPAGLFASPQLSRCVTRLWRMLSGLRARSSALAVFKGGNLISTLLRFGRIQITDAIVFSNCAYRGAYRTFQLHLQSIEGRTNGSGEGVQQVPGRAAVGGLPRRASREATPCGPNSVHGFEIGDQAKAVVPKGNKQGTYPGRVALRETGAFNLKTSTATVEGINHKHCRLIQRGGMTTACHLVSHFQPFIGKERACSPARTPGSEAHEPDEREFGLFLDRARHF
jgi:hypothetical protein